MIEQSLLKKFKEVGVDDFSVTYRMNKTEGVFGWYPYTEGFSKSFVDDMLAYYGVREGKTVLDPFGGCGTTILSCTLKNINSVSVEVNPFMHFVLEAKYNALRLSPKKIALWLEKLKNRISQTKKSAAIPTFLRNEEFFNPHNLSEALRIKQAIDSLNAPKKIKQFFMLHLTSLLVRISNMVRATDLKYRQMPQESLDVSGLFFEKVREAIEDMRALSSGKRGSAILINEDIGSVQRKAKNLIGKVDYFITSPPYLNGTNYERNTKLEMGFLDMIRDTADLKELRKKMITAGINSTQSDSDSLVGELKFLEPLVAKVAKSAYDKRIPKMVAGYFNDMNRAIQNIYLLMRRGGKGVIVIGDSQFGGVHIPTDILLAKICGINGFKVKKMRAVRERTSRNGMKLRETLVFVEK